MKFRSSPVQGSCCCMTLAVFTNSPKWVPSGPWCAPPLPSIPCTVQFASAQYVMCFSLCTLHFALCTGLEALCIFSTPCPTQVLCSGPPMGTGSALSTKVICCTKIPLDVRLLQFCIELCPQVALETPWGRICPFNISIYSILHFRSILNF